MAEYPYCFKIQTHNECGRSFFKIVNRALSLHLPFGRSFYFSLFLNFQMELHSIFIHLLEVGFYFYFLIEIVLACGVIQYELTERHAIRLAFDAKRVGLNV